MPASTAPSGAASDCPYAARICSTSARYSASASMELMVVGKSVEILLKNDAGGFGVDFIEAAAGVGAHAALAQVGPGVDRRIAFVHPLHGHVETSVHLIAEALGERAHFMR